VIGKARDGVQCKLDAGPHPLAVCRLPSTVQYTSSCMPCSCKASIEIAISNDPSTPVCPAPACSGPGRPCGLARVRTTTTRHSTSFFRKAQLRHMHKAESSRRTVVTVATGARRLFFFLAVTFLVPSLAYSTRHYCMIDRQGYILVDAMLAAQVMIMSNVQFTSRPCVPAKWE
jgi:hypothetical protein